VAVVAFEPGAGACAALMMRTIGTHLNSLVLRNTH